MGFAPALSARAARFCFAPPRGSRRRDTSTLWRRLPTALAAAAVARLGLPPPFLAVLSPALCARLVDLDRRPSCFADEWDLPPCARRLDDVDFPWIERVLVAALGVHTGIEPRGAGGAPYGRSTLDLLAAEWGSAVRVLCHVGRPWVVAHVLDVANREVEEASVDDAFQAAHVYSHQLVFRTAAAAARESERWDLLAIVHDRAPVSDVG
ncbi:hypothetical protein HK405_012594, partial [Cladochytrium tenue]